MKGAFDTPGHMMINSAVPGLNENTGTDWSDFMTICPSFKGSTAHFKRNDGQDLRPILTLGISYRVEDFDSLKQAARALYLLEYIDINYVLEMIMDDFIEKFKLNHRGLVDLLQLQNVLARIFS